VWRRRVTKIENERNRKIDVEELPVWLNVQPRPLKKSKE